ncbi:DUF5984 family protein [Flavobacterium amniphilum]|uniref:DUF5984 family protein n=1 Tax=Flavobacterium amniphilum TaxID=1834035 RepID=UPI002029F5D9|nr:DUF5984 family protein [Flavobacterium amniphilum]MCL9806894.1 DUF5984 family protein [Flavobacterium amniphilum]
MIHFQLKKFDEITPVGQEPNLLLSWFWMTEGDLWLTFGEQTIYEYTKEAIQYFGDKATPYNDYYIVRFLVDFTALFEKISQSLPDYLYRLTENIALFKEDVQQWYDLHDTEENGISDFHFDQYDKLTTWRLERTFDSAHLVGGPHLSFFRHNEKIRIVWDIEHTLENGISLWTAKDGSIEMNYADFANGVKAFGEQFFKSMDKQIELALAKNWGDIQVDKILLAEEHEDRKSEFEQSLSFLSYETTSETDWPAIEELHKRMKNDLK